MATTLKKHRIRIAFGALLLLAAIAVPAGSAAASTWTLRRLPPTPRENGSALSSLSGVSCPTESLCVAVGGLDTLAFSQDPTGGVASWHLVEPDYPIGAGTTCVEGEPQCHVPSGALEAVSCASPSLCATVTYDGIVFVSTDPTAGAGAWSGSVLNQKGQKGATHLTAISCTPPSFCAAVSGGSNNSNGGKILTSNDPVSGHWQVAELGSSLDLRSISCSTSSFCVAVARGGRIFVSTDPAGGASAWSEAGRPGGPGDLEGVSCVASLLCAVGNQSGNILTSIDPALGPGASWNEANAGGSVQITGVSCPTADACLAVDNNGDVMTSTSPTGGASAWSFENLVPFSAEEEPRNALFAASCASTSLCALVGRDGRIFTATDPFTIARPSRPHRQRKAPRRPRTFLVYAEHFWQFSSTRRPRLRARFHFYSPTRTRGFECKRDHGRYRRCRSPYRYWVKHGHHVLRVRAIGPTGLRGPAAVKRFWVLRPGQHRP
jgi:hypothetical protein